MNMKTKIFTLLLITSAILAFSSCEKTKASNFDYPLEDLYGIWDATHIYLEDSKKWQDITLPGFEKLAISIRFNEDGTYYGDGYFGRGNGTYMTNGSTIVTYIDGEEYARYDVISLNDKTAELTMIMGTSTIKIRAIKEY